MKNQLISKNKKEPSKFDTVITSKPAASVALKWSRAVVVLLLAHIFLLLAAPSANAATSPCIQFDLTQGRVTVPINSINSTLITNFVKLAGGCTNANFSVSGLPAGVGVVLTDTNLNPLTSITSSTNVWITVNTTNIVEGLYLFRVNAGGFDTNSNPVTNSFPFYLQAAHIWNGSLNATNGWSDPASWLGGVPTATDDAVFSDQGAQTNNGATSGSYFTNIFVTANTTVASVRFSQPALTNSPYAVAAGATNPPASFHYIQIAPATTLTVTGTNGFSMMRDYFNEESAKLGSIGVFIGGGSGSKLYITNLNANIANFTDGQLSSGPVPNILNMSNLQNFVVNVSRVGFGDYQIYPNYQDLNTALNAGNDSNSYSGYPWRMSSAITLAQTNVITAYYKDPQNYTNEYTRGYAFTLFNNEQNGVGGTKNTLQLGNTNTFLMDGVCFFGANGNGTVGFAPTNNPVAKFRNTDGVSGMSIFTVSDDGGTNEASTSTKGTVNFAANNGTVDILATNFYLSRDREQIATNNTPNVQADFTIGKGIVNVNRAILGYQEHTKPDWTVIGGGQPYLNYCQGRLVVTNGGKFQVNGTLTLGYTADTNSPADAQQYNTYGQITIFSNSIVTASNIVCDGNLNFYDTSQPVSRLNNITINQGGTLVVSNTMGGPNFTGSQYPTFANTGSPGLPVDTLTMAQGSTLTLNVTVGTTNCFVRNFVSSGLTPSTIKIATLSGVTSYPATIPLIAYSTATPFVTADVSAIVGIPNLQGYIQDSGQSLDLLLTTNLPKQITWRGTANGFWDQTSINWVLTGTSTPTNFAQGDIVTFDDGTIVTNITVKGVVIPNQATNGVVITNNIYVYTFSQFSGSSAIAGTAKIVKQGTNLVQFECPESGPISITAGEVDVDGSGIIGTTTLFSNAVLQVNSGGLAGGLTSTGLVTVASGGNMSGAITLYGGWLWNNGGTIGVPTGSELVVSNTAIVTNDLNGTINLGASGTVGEIFGAATLANFGDIEIPGGTLQIDGVFYGTGSVQDSIDNNILGTYGRIQMGAASSPLPLLSPGSVPYGSISNMYLAVRLDFDTSGPRNEIGQFLIELTNSGSAYDYLTLSRWGNESCFWVMTNLDNSPFTLGQSFHILQNANAGGPNDFTVTNYTGNTMEWPLMQPSVPGPGLVWNLSQEPGLGLVSVTNINMVWTGANTNSWDTNGTMGAWQGTYYTNALGAIFNDTASNGNVTLNNPVAPADYNILGPYTNIVPNVSTNIYSITNAPSFAPGMVVSNSTLTYTMSGSGSISGITALYKAGSGTLNLLTTNSFSGGIILDGGTLATTNSSYMTTSVKQGYNQLVIDNNSTLRWYGPGTNANIGLSSTIKAGGATIEVSSNYANFTVNLAVNGPGALTKTGAGTLVINQSDLYAGGTLVNAGTLQLAGPTGAGLGNITLANNTTFELNANGNNFTPTNVLDVMGTGTVIKVDTTNVDIYSGPWIDSGTTTFTATNNITTTNPPTLFIFNAALTNFSGTVSFGTTSNNYRFNYKTNSAPCTGSAGATFDLGTGSAFLNTVDKSNMVYNLGALAGGPNTTLAGSVSNAFVQGTTFNIGANGSSTTFSGKITNGLDTVTVVKVGSGSLLLNGTSTYTGSTTVSNGVLGGTGSIASPLTVVAGTLSPGAPVGAFTVNNSVTLGGTTYMVINRSNPATNSEVVVTGTLTGGGALTVTNVGPTLINGSTFQLFSKAVPAASFSSITLPTGGGSYVWTTNLTLNGSITLVSGGVNAVNTNPTNLTYNVSGSTLTLSWPGDHLGWGLQVQTNALSTGLVTSSNAWFNISGASTVTNEVMTINTTNGTVFYRMIYPPGAP